MFDIKLKRISYIVNNICNLNCKHCFQSFDARHDIQLNPDIALKATKFALFHNKLKNRNIEITIIGGEPVLYQNYKELEKTFNFIIENNYKISILRVFTNGTLINNDLINLLNNFKNKVEKIYIFVTKDILIDNPSRVNIYNKSFNNEIDQSIEKLKLLNFNVVIQYIFSPCDVPFWDQILDKIILNKDIILSYAYPDKYDFTLDDFNYIIKIFNKKINYLDYDIFYRSGLNIYYDIITGNIFDACRDKNYVKCDPIKGEFSISPKGYIIPCVKVLDNENDFKELHIDNIEKNPKLFFENKLLNNYVSYSDINEHGFKCSECICNPYCHQCRLFKNIINNDKYIPHSFIQCQRMKLLVDAINNNLGDFL